MNILERSSVRTCGGDVDIFADRWEGLNTEGCPTKIGREYCRIVIGPNSKVKTMILKQNLKINDFMSKADSLLEITLSINSNRKRKHTTHK